MHFGAALLGHRVSRSIASLRKLFKFLARSHFNGNRVMSCSQRNLIAIQSISASTEAISGNLIAASPINSPLMESRKSLDKKWYWISRAYTRIVHVSSSSKLRVPRRAFELHTLFDQYGIFTWHYFPSLTRRTRFRSASLGKSSSEPDLSGNWFRSRPIYVEPSLAHYLNTNFFPGCLFSENYTPRFTDNLKKLIHEFVSVDDLKFSRKKKSAGFSNGTCTA